MLDFDPDRPVPGCPAIAKVFVDGDHVAEARVERQIPQRAGTECFDVKTADRPCATTTRTEAGSRFTGTIESVTFEFGDSEEPSGMDRLEMATKLD